MNLFNIVAICAILGYLSLCLALFGKTRTISLSVYKWIDLFGGEQNKLAVKLGKAMFSIFGLFAPFCILLGTSQADNQLPFILAATGLMIVGIFCLYKYSTVGIMHIFGVILAIIGVLYFVYLESLWIITVPCGLFGAILCYLDRENKGYWLELTAISILFIGMALRGYFAM